MEFVERAGGTWDGTTRAPCPVHMALMATFWRACDRTLFPTELGCTDVLRPRFGAGLDAYRVHGTPGFLHDHECVSDYSLQRFERDTGPHSGRPVSNLDRSARRSEIERPSGSQTTAQRQAAWRQQATLQSATGTHRAAHRPDAQHGFQLRINHLGHGAQSPRPK